MNVNVNGLINSRFGIEFGGLATLGPIALLLTLPPEPPLYSPPYPTYPIPELRIVLSEFNGYSIVEEGLDALNGISVY